MTEQNGNNKPNEAEGLAFPLSGNEKLIESRSPLVVLAGGRPTDGLHPGWAAIHKRVSRLRGKASGYPCVDCGGAASEWSYDNKDPDHLVDPRLKIAYSLSTNHYVPRCIPCHRAFDANHRNSLTKERLT